MNPGSTLGRVECFFDATSTKHERLGLYYQSRERFEYPMCHGGLTGTHGLRVEGPNIDNSHCEIKVGPSEAEDFTAPHTGINRGDDDGLQICSRAITRHQQSNLFFTR